MNSHIAEEPFGQLIATLGTVRAAALAGNKDLAFEAVTIALMQTMHRFGRDNTFMQSIFPLLEELKILVQSEQYAEAATLVVQLVETLQDDH